MEGMHARAFVVAGAVKAELVEDLHAAITRALAEGRTLADFRRDFDAIVARHGWRHRGGRDWRSRVIFDTNMRMARAAGRWQQIRSQADKAPWLRYVSVRDARTRPQHAVWHGTVLRVDAPWWHTHYPPNGWRCRCTVQQMSDRDLDRYGVSPNDEAPPVEMEERQINTPEGPRPWKTPAGIDTGFGHNVGIAAHGRVDAALAMERHGPWTPLAHPAGRSVPPELPEISPRPAPATVHAVAAEGEAALRARLRRALGGKDTATLFDPTGAAVTLSQAIVDHVLELERRLDGRDRFFPLLSALVTDPDEIWVGFAVSDESGRVALRRRYVAWFRDEKNRLVGLVADQDGAAWSGLTFIPGGSLSRLRNLRSGLLVYRRGG